MTTFTRTPRNTGGFSLDDAARVIRNCLQDVPSPCPSCGGALRRVVGAEYDDQVCLLRCDACGRGMVFRKPMMPPARRGKPA